MSPPTSFTARPLANALESPPHNRGTFFAQHPLPTAARLVRRPYRVRIALHTKLLKL